MGADPGRELSLNIGISFIFKFHPRLLPTFKF